MDSLCIVSTMEMCRKLFFGIVLLSGLFVLWLDMKLLWDVSSEHILPYQENPTLEERSLGAPEETDSHTEEEAIWPQETEQTEIIEVDTSKTEDTNQEGGEEEEKGEVNEGADMVSDMNKEVRNMDGLDNKEKDVTAKEEERKEEMNTQQEEMVRQKNEEENMNKPDIIKKEEKDETDAKKEEMNIKEGTANVKENAIKEEESKNDNKETKYKELDTKKKETETKEINPDQSTKLRVENEKDEDKQETTSSEYVKISGRARRIMKRKEISRYGSQYISLSFLGTDHQPIRFLPNYRNPCWYQRKQANNEEDVELNCLPYFYVPGVAKCGTTNLYYLLQQHHQVAPPNDKEMYYLMNGIKMDPGFFSKATDTIFSTIQYTTDDNSTWIHPIVTYDATPASLYTRPHHYIIEHRNFTFLTKADLIHQFLPSPKIVVMLREPTARTFSDYNHFKHLSLQHFHEFVETAIKIWDACMRNNTRRYCAYLMVERYRQAPLGMSVYDVFLYDWMSVFGRENFHVISLEEMHRDLPSTIAGIVNFLQLEPMKESMMQELSSPSSPALSPHQKDYPYGREMLNSTKEILDRFYYPHLVRLKRLLGDRKWMWGHQ